MTSHIVHGYDRARICVNGHIIDDEVGRSGRPAQPFCDLCGAEVMTTCQECQTPIRGSYAIYAPTYKGEPDVEHEQYVRPAHCYQCGAALPWTASALDAAHDLTETIEALRPNERQQLRDTFPDLIADTPRTTVAAVRFRTLVAKGGEDVIRLFAAQFADLMVARAAGVIPFMHR